MRVLNAVCESKNQGGVVPIFNVDVDVSFEGRGNSDIVDMGYKKARAVKRSLRGIKGIYLDEDRIYPMLLLTLSFKGIVAESREEAEEVIYESVAGIYGEVQKIEWSEVL